jgi:branched-subunit amino acid transport protein
VSSVWIAVALAGAGSYLMRVLPLLLGERAQLSPRAQDVLRHTGMGGLTALLVLGVLGAVGSGGASSAVPVVGALLVSGGCAWARRSMVLTVAAGAAAYGLLSLLPW